jgi:SAM-dependent methyltransferase
MKKFSAPSRRRKAAPALFRGRTNSKTRPEDSHPAGDFYRTGEGDSHREKNAIRNIQGKITLRAMQLLAIFPPARVLDAGCGSGFSSQIAKGLGFEVSGFDLDSKMVQAAIRNGIDARLGNLIDIPYGDSSFDAIISISSLQWLGAGKSPKAAFEEYYAAAREFFRVLAPAGRAAIQFYPKDEAEAMNAGRAFRKAGFAVTLQVDNADNPVRRKIFLVLKKQKAVK